MDWTISASLPDGTFPSFGGIHAIFKKQLLELFGLHTLRFRA